MLVPASHGETVTQILGSGDAARPFQAFELKQLPLTYRAATNESGAASELTLRIGAIEWHERNTLYGAAATDRAFALDVDEQGRNLVKFGDGANGARLPSGLNNVRISYRKGIRYRRQCPRRYARQLLSRPLGLKGVATPLRPKAATTGACGCRTPQHPLGARTLGRVVLVLDYEDFARAFSGIAGAAQVLRLPRGKNDQVTDPCRRRCAWPVPQAQWTQPCSLRSRPGGDPRFAVALLPYQPGTFRIGLKVKRDPDFDAKAVLAAVDVALRAHFAFDARGLGQRSQQSDAIAQQQRSGVIAIDLVKLYGGTTPYAATIPRRRRTACSPRGCMSTKASRCRASSDIEPGAVRPAGRRWA